MAEKVRLTGGNPAESYEFICWTTKEGVMVIRDSKGNEFYASGSVDCAVMICPRE